MTRLRMPTDRPLATLAAATRDLLFPPVCFACGMSLAEQRDGPAPDACRECREELALLVGAGCRRCGAPTALEPGDPAPCFRCRGAALKFDEGIAAGLYEGLLRDLVLRAKRSGEESVALALGRMMWRRAGDRLRSLRPDVVTVVPMHWRRRLARQTNAPELMGEVVADRLRAPFAPRLLRRRRATHRQPTLPHSERLPNVRGALGVRRGYGLSGATVVLIDDILTTGATCSEAARALKHAGAERVVVVVAARSL